MDDIRYSEFKFLQALESGLIDNFHSGDEKQTELVGLDQRMYVQMAATLIEDLNVQFADDNTQLLVAKLRGELFGNPDSPFIQRQQWDNPRAGILSALNRQHLMRLCITYRGLRRIEELRELLRRDCRIR